ncbi:MAG: DUF4935 domain-containing protein [Deltaproteobacteria bacterium]|nr:DUF4935 domain-containing protein [Deltaproteobacteria bacterium]
MQFPFGLPRLQPLMDRLDAGDIRVVISEVIAREICEHVSANVIKAKKAHAKFRRDATITRIINDPDIPVLITEVDWEAVRKATLAAVNLFFMAHGVEVIPIHGEDAAGVFADYFACRAPFGEDKKKSEFPDSFAMKALLRYAESEKCKIAVVSEDGDWKKACADHAELVHCPSLEQLVDYSQTAKVELHSEIRELLDSHSAELELAVLESFRDRGFYWDSDEGYDAEVEETYDENVESWPRSVIATEDGWADIAGDARIHFRATAIYPDPDSCFRDPDTKELVHFGNVHAKLVSTITVQVRVWVNIESLKQNEIKFKELIVEDDRDIWFRGDMIEELYPEIEDYEE